MNDYDLVLEHVYLSYIIMDTISALNQLQETRITLGGLLVVIGKEFGRRTRDKQQENRKQLQQARLYPRIVDDGGDVVHINVARPGGQVRHSITRKDLDAGVKARREKLMGEIFDLRPQKYDPDEPYVFKSSLVRG